MINAKQAQSNESSLVANKASNHLTVSSILRNRTRSNEISIEKCADICIKTPDRSDKKRAHSRDHYDTKDHSKLSKISGPITPVNCSSDKSSISTSSIRYIVKCQPNGDGSSAITDLGKLLLEAARDGRTEQVRQLVVTSGAPFTCDWLGTTALHLAAQNSHHEITAILLRAGVNKDARTKLERTALHLAAQKGSLDIVDMLLDYGSSIDPRDMLKMTPLHWAVERNHFEVAKRLVYKGADIFATSKFLLTPIEMAHQSKCSKMINLFNDVLERTMQCNTNRTLMGSVSMINSSAAVPRVSFSHTNDSTLVSLANRLTLPESHGSNLDVEYYLKLDNEASEFEGREDESTKPNSILDLAGESCLDMVEFELDSLNYESDFLLNQCQDDEPRVEYLMKIVGELQRENLQLRQKVEQLTSRSVFGKLNWFGQ